MRLLSKISNVRGIYFQEGFFLVLNLDYIRYYNSELVNVWNVKLDGISTSCFIFNNVAFVEYISKDTGFEITAVIENNSGQILNSIEYMLRSVSSSNECIALRYNSDYSSKIFCIDLSTFNVLWENDFECLPYFYGDTLISAAKNSINFLSKDGKYIWSFSTSTLDAWKDYDGVEKQVQVTKILGIYNDRIYIYLNSGKILILDAGTGNKITVLRNDKHPEFDTFGNSIELDINSGKLIQLANQDLIEVNLETLEVVITRIGDMKSLGLENYSDIVFDANHIFFSDKNRQTIGALNRFTYKLDWTYDFLQNEKNEPGKPVYGKEMKLNADRLYVLDNKNSLHVLEKL